MPRYYFDITDGGPQCDDIGTEFDDIQAVRLEAITTLAEVARDQIPANGVHCAFGVAVRDGGGQVVYSASLSFVETSFKTQ